MKPVSHAFPVLLLGALVAQQPTTVEATIKIADTTNRDAPVAPTSETVTLSKTAPAGALAAANVVEPWFGQLALGGKKVNFVVGKSKADAAQPDLLCVDLDINNVIADSERLAITVEALPVRGNTPSPGVRSQPKDLEFALTGGKLVAKGSFMRMGERDPSLQLVFPGYLEAKVKVGNEERIVAVLDKDLDGKFGGAADLWVLAKAGDRPATPYALSALGERRFDNGQLVGISIDKNIVKVATTPATAPDAKDAAAHRARVEHIWSERFDKEREEFVKGKVDTTRKLATQPIQWHYVSFDEAIALGKKANKPVFIDVMAFWCVWCYRMDYYTYPDQEVAALLNDKFIPVKVIQEQAVAGDYDKLMKEKLAAKGIPAMGIFDGDGNVVHTIGGWKNAEGFIKELQTGLEGKKAEPAKDEKKEEKKDAPKDGGKK